MEWRKESFPKILFVVGGRGVLRRRTKKFAIQAPALIVVPEGISHRFSDERGDPMSLYGICFDNPSFPSRSLISAVCGSWRLEIGADLPIDATELLKAIMAEERNRTDESEDLQLSLIGQLLVSLARCGNRKPFRETLNSRSRVQAYAERLSSSFWKTEDLDSVARSLGLSRRRFTQIFREVTEESWLEHLTRLRMKHAARLLNETCLSVRSICFECGYSELSNFYRVFKTSFGVSPGQWRESERRSLQISIPRKNLRDPLFLSG